MSDKNKNIENDDDSEYTTLDSSKEDWRVAQEEFYGEYPNYLGIGSWPPESFGRTEADVYGKTLNPLEAASMLCLLEDAVDELTILKYAIGAPTVSSWDFHYKAPSVKLKRTLTPTRIFPEVDSKPDLTPAIKLQRDREQVETVIRKLMKYLANEYSFIPLITAVRDLEKQEEDDEKLVEDLKNNLLYLKDLSKAVKEKRKRDDLEEKSRDELMYQLQDEMDDVILKCNVEERFVNKWENVRNAQNLWKLRNAENYYKENINKFAMKMKIEKRVTHELQLYLKTNQAELEEELEQWMSLYDSEMERRENKILHLKYNRDQAENNKNRLLELYEVRRKEIKEWITFRDLRNKRKKASLMIQCWWRGIMVRKKLGPYKPKKPPKKKSYRKKK